MLDPAHATPDPDRLWAEAYEDLKRLARSRLRQAGAGHLLDTVGLINDVWLRLSDQRSLPPTDRGRFFAYCSQVMHSVVVDLVREQQAQRRGGGAQFVTLNTALGDALPAVDPLWVDEALGSLASLEPRLAEVVKMRYFGGFTEAEIGEVLGVTERTVRRDWEKARLLLQSMLSE